MKTLLVAAAFVGLIPLAGSADNPKPIQDRKEPAKKESPPVSLRVGDPAPTLKASKWLQGEQVRKFEPGKVYVVEFWAVWCGWCIAFMPHAAELQDQYRDRSVTFLFYTARDPDNTEEKVAALVKKRGPKLPFTFAYAEDRTTYDAWVTAAGREGLPCTFVVDKTGRIAYIGHPMYLGVVLPRVIAGNKKPQEVSAEVDKIEQEFRAVSRAFWPDNKVGFKALKEFEAKYPSLANNPAILRSKLGLLPGIGEVDEAKKLAEAIVAQAIKQGNPSALGQVAALLRNGSGRASKELLAVAVKAAEAEVRLTGGQDARVLIDLAETYFVAGDKIKAAEYCRKAVEAAAGDSAALQYVEPKARKIADEKQHKK